MIYGEKHEKKKKDGLLVILLMEEFQFGVTLIVLSCADMLLLTELCQHSRTQLVSETVSKSKRKEKVDYFQYGGVSYDSIKTSVSNLSDHLCNYNEVIRFVPRLYSYRKCLMFQLSRKDQSRTKMFFCLILAICNLVIEVNMFIVTSTELFSTIIFWTRSSC